MAQDNEMPAFRTDTLLSLLAEKAAPHLSAQELEWINEFASNTASYHGLQLGCTIENIACVVRNDKGDWMIERDAVADLLTVLADQVQTIAAVGDIGSFAKSMIANRKMQAKGAAR